MELKTKTNALDIPAVWAKIPLGNVCTLHNGRAFHRSEWESEGTPVIRLQNLTGGDDYYYSTLSLPANKYCEQGDLLYMWSATFGPTIWRGPKAIYHYHIWRVDIKETIVSKDFLYFKLDEITQRLKERETSGSTMLHLTKQKMEKTNVLLPPLPEQRAIAEVLSDVDALIEQLDALIAKKRAVKTATMQRLLTGKQRLPGFSEPWETRRLGDLSTMSSGGTPLSSVSKYYGGNIPWVSVSDLSDAGKYLSQTERHLTQEGLLNSAAKLFPPESVLYAMYASIGEVCIASFEVSSSQAILGIQTGAQLINQFLYYVLSHKKEKIRQIGQQGTQANLNSGMVKNLEIPLPVIEEQEAIAQILSDMDAEIEALEARREKTQRLKQGMMQELLTGRTRLV